MPAWLAPVVTGLASVAGSLFSNQGNRRQAEKQMAFQERMSSTAAQRSAADYAAAGLNPALAYDRPASSPGGVSATIGDAIGPGVSSAMSARRLQSELKLLEEQKLATAAQGRKAAFEAQKAEVESRIAVNTEKEATDTANARSRFERALQPHELSSAASGALLQKALVPGATAQGDLDRMMGIYGPILKSIPLGPLTALLRKRSGGSRGGGPPLTLDGRPLRFGPKRDY